MNSNKKVLNMLGLARRAGKVESGEFATEKAVKTGKAHLVIVSSEASANTTKQFRNMCDYYKVPCLILAEKEELGHSIGQGMRASLAVTDENFARTIEKLVRETGDGGCENGERE